MTDTSETRSADSAAHATQQSRLHRLMRYIPLIAPVLLWAVPCWLLLHTGQHWPLPVTLVGTALFALGLVGMPLAMVRGHGRRQQDRAAIVGDTLLGTSWVLFTWSVLLGVFLRLALTMAGVDESQDRARIVTWGVLGITAVLLAWGTPKPAACHACAASTCNFRAWVPGWTASASSSSPTPITAPSIALAGRHGSARG